MTKELVVSVYDEDISWLNDISSDIKITLYSKDHNTHYPNGVSLPNIGREQHTFMYHIVNNYDVLSDYIFFSQGNPFDHIENYVEIINGDVETWDKYSSQHFENFWAYHWNSRGTMWELHPSHQFGGNVICCDKTWYRVNRFLQLNTIWNVLFLNKCPDTFEFTPGAHYNVSKSQIHLKNLEFYKKLLYFTEIEKEAPWILERFTAYIFHSTIIPKKFYETHKN